MTMFQPAIYYTIYDSYALCWRKEIISF